MAHSDRSRSPTRPQVAPPPSNPRLPGFPRWHGPMHTAIRTTANPTTPIRPHQVPPPQHPLLSQFSPMMFSQPSPMMIAPRHPFPPAPPSLPMSNAPSTPCSPTQPCSLPSSQGSPSPPPSTTPPPRRNIQSPPSSSTREYGFDLNEQWQQDSEFYDNQKQAGLTFPRAIRTSAFSSKLDIEGCDPLKLPVAALLYQQHNNHWLRKLAWGREVYLVPVGDMAGVVFATELLSQLRSRGIDLDRVSQHKARQEGKTLDKTGNTKFTAQLIAEHIQNWLPVRGTDPESQHQITTLQAELAKLRQQLGDAPSDSATAAPASSSGSANTPIGRSLMGNNAGTPPPPSFDPASLLSVPGSENTWLAKNQPKSMAKTPMEKWLKNLDLSNAQRATLTANLEKVNTWWQQQSEDAVGQIHKVAVMTGIPATMISSNVNMDSLLQVLTAAITMTT